jgi:enoyl-CoA hydratase/carnithine racemase
VASVSTLISPGSSDTDSRSSPQSTVAAATDYARTLATTTGPNAVAVTKHQLSADLLHLDPAASVTESLRLLDDCMATEEYREGIAALTEKRPPRFAPS